MTVDDAVSGFARRFERDLWIDLASAPADPELVQDACFLLAQLMISEEASKRHGTPHSYAVAFIQQVDELALKIDMLGGPKRLNRSLLWLQFEQVEIFASALLDLMIENGS